LWIQARVLTFEQLSIAYTLIERCVVGCNGIPFGENILSHSSLKATFYGTLIFGNLPEIKSRKLPIRESICVDEIHFRLVNFLPSFRSPLL
jgi:hypothetical protein